jgi:hypothetical protein
MASYGWTRDCCECQIPVGNQQRQDDIHDVCSQRTAIARAIEYLKAADDLLAATSAESHLSNSAVESALIDLCADFGWKPPVAKPVGRQTWNAGFYSGDAA